MHANIDQISINVRGRTVSVPCLRVGDLSIVKTGKFLKTATVHDQEWQADPNVRDPGAVIEAMSRNQFRADIFSFFQTVFETTPQYSYPMDWDNVAVVKLTDFNAWWKALPQESRKNVRRGEKRGVVARSTPFGDTLVAGIKNLYDETPTRQGRAFWHYGKSLDIIRAENATYLNRSEFVGAYLGNELIGFLKMVYTGKAARIMQILSKNAHADKRPPNILLAKAIEVCCQRGMEYFIYGQYYYGKKGHTPITEFKRRNGFECLQIPRYSVPLTVKGRVSVAFRLHKGIKEILPGRISRFLLYARGRYYAGKSQKCLVHSESSAQLKIED